MRARPKGAKYRNLYAYQSSIWYERVVHGRRYRVNTQTTDWGEAARFRDLYEETRGVEQNSRNKGARTP